LEFAPETLIAPPAPTTIAYCTPVDILAFPVRNPPAPPPPPAEEPPPPPPATTKYSNADGGGLVSSVGQAPDADKSYTLFKVNISLYIGIYIYFYIIKTYNLNEYLFQFGIL
jgi:hypothetical protein